MNLSANYFELFNLPVRFALDRAALDSAYRAVQGEVHPDRFVDADDAGQRVSMQLATRVNEAYVALKSPLSRARYLLQLAGIDLGAERNTAMPHDFLMEQLEWREAVDEARQAGDLRELEHQHHRLRALLDGRYAAFGELFDAGVDHLRENAEAAALASDVRKLMFLEKLLQDIDEAIAELEDAA